MPRRKLERVEPSLVEQTAAEEESLPPSQSQGGEEPRRSLAKKKKLDVLTSLKECEENLHPNDMDNRNNDDTSSNKLLANKKPGVKKNGGLAARPMLNNNATTSTESGSNNRVSTESTVLSSGRITTRRTAKSLSNAATTTTSSSSFPIYVPPPPEIPHMEARKKNKRNSNEAGSSNPSNPADDYRLPPRPLDVEDIDQRREHDPAYVTAYVKDTYAYARSLQFREPVSSTFMMDRGDKITATMRAVLINWIIEVVDEFEMSSDVLHLTVALIDRALRFMQLTPSTLQLLGCAAMLIASKFEDVFAPGLDDFVKITDQTYTREEIIRMECKVLKSLDYRIVTATPKPFLRRFQRAARVSTVDEKALSNYFTEIALPFSIFARFTPSLIAAAAVYLACLTLDPEKKQSAWTKELRYYSTYEEVELRYVVKLLHEHHVQAPTHPHLVNCYRKFCTREWSHVANQIAVAPEWCLPPVLPESITLGGK